ncbi:MAG: DNA helicase [Lachnoclostridium sp.]|jgi:hypothetical protein
MVNEMKLITEMNKVHNILNYWYNLEFFSPFWPETTKDTVFINNVNNRIPWMSEKPDHKFTYDVYLGKIKSQDLIINMMDSIGEKDDFIEDDYSQSCICAFKLTSDGRYIKESFSVSTFVWAVAKITVERNLRIDLSTEDIDKFNRDMNDILISFNKKLDYKDLEKICTIVMGKISLSINNSIFFAVINKKFVRKENVIKKVNSNTQDIQEEEEDDIDINTDMLSSFYASDIDMVRSEVRNGDKITKYIEALKKPASERIEIDNDISQMKKWLSPEKYPLGKWPSTNSPSLMQQVAINIAISNNEYSGDIFSVNGPPGTGKTTLLKEIIASNIVERALLLSEYQKPDDAFLLCQFDLPENEFLKHYYKPDLKLTKFGIIVASNNNAAVENISKELPIAEDVKKSNTKLFNLDENEEIYFTNIANTLMGDKEVCWGLISASLGKKSNINELKRALWFNKEGVNLQQLFKEEKPDWDQARNIFKNKYSEVINYRKSIAEAVEKTTNHKKIAQEYYDAKNDIISAKGRITAQENLINQKKVEQQNIKQHIEVLKENEALLKSRLSFFKMMFSFLFKKDPIILQLKHMKQEQDKEIIKLTDINQQLVDLNAQLDTMKADFAVAQKQFNEKERIFENSCEQMKKYKEQFGKNFADDEFWKDIQSNESSQLASPWTNKTYDMLREELFYYSLLLHKAFILNSKAVKQNINCLMNMWNGCFSEKDRVSSYAHLLNTLLLIIPVVSTTFASVSTFLEHIGKNELGTLIIDEAGQATPYSALGALWRTRKAIIVGNPLQVEPIVTVPKELSKRFADEFEIEDSYRQQELSVQVLADNINPYGGYREYLNGKLWIGCPLVVHRRCLNPMFSISNKVAYNNRMFNRSAEPKPDVSLLLKKSVWIDIKGKENGGKDHFVPEQGDKVIEMVLDAFALKNEYPSLYIISPFKSVIQNMKSLLRKHIYNKYKNLKKDDIDNWINKSCGTIHTFQGKEANEVILILGCDEKTGIGAAQWASIKPNILNVAVTRAKYRIAIIGDSDLWRQMPYFDYAYNEILRAD